MGVRRSWFSALHCPDPPPPPLPTPLHRLSFSSSDPLSLFLMVYPLSSLSVWEPERRDGLWGGVWARQGESDRFNRRAERKTALLQSEDNAIGRIAREFTEVKCCLWIRSLSSQHLPQRRHTACLHMCIYLCAWCQQTHSLCFLWTSDMQANRYFTASVSVICQQTGTHLPHAAIWHLNYIWGRYVFTML